MKPGLIAVLVLLAALASAAVSEIGEKRKTNSHLTARKDKGTTKQHNATAKDDEDYDDDDDVVYDEDDYDDDDDYYYYDDDEEEDNTIYKTDASGCPTPFLGRCKCGMMMYLNQEKYVVNCTNAGFTNASMLRALPDNTEVLIFTGNFLEVLPTNIFGTVSDFEDLETIDMSNNAIKEIKGKTYHRVSNVKTLILNHNSLYIVDSRHHPRVFSNFQNLENLHLTNAFTEDVDSKWYMVSLEIIFQGSKLTKLKKLHLEQNEIWSLRDPRTFCHLPSLQHLYLGSNRLAGIDFSLLCLEKLSYVDLEYNSIRRLNQNATQQLDQLTARTSNFAVKLTGNPFFCDCNMRPFLDWLTTTKTRVLDRETYRCFEGRPESNVNLPLDQVRQLDCAPQPPSESATGLSQVETPSNSAATAVASSSFSSVLIGVLVFIICVLLALMAYMHRSRLARRVKNLQPQLQIAIRNVKRARQYTNIEHEEDAPEVDV